MGHDTRKNVIYNIVFLTGIFLIFNMMVPGALFSPQIAEADGSGLYSIDKKSPKLYEINVDPFSPGFLSEVIATHTITLSGFPIKGGSGLAFHDGEMYALLKNPGGDRILVTIDTSTGDATFIGFTDIRIGTLASDGTTLVGISPEAFEAPSIYIIDPTDASTTFSCELPDDVTGNAMTFNSDDGKFYRAADTLFERINDFSVDPCNITLISSGFSETSSLVYLGFGFFLAQDTSFPINPDTNKSLNKILGIDGTIATIDSEFTPFHPSKGLVFVGPLSGPPPPDVSGEGTLTADHYLGYDAKIPKGEPKFLKFTVELSDQFETATYTVDKIDRLFNPVIKNGEGVLLDKDSHYVGYKINTPKDEPKFETVTNILVQNQFGVITVDVKKPKLLLVPSAKDHFTTPDSLVLPLNVNHFKCYNVKESMDTPKFEKLIVLVDDPNFGITQEFEVKKPKMLCTPVDKNGEGIVDEENHLMCYDIKKLEGDPKFEKLSVFTNNQFGPEELEVKKQKQLCVPSVKILL